MGNNVNYMSLRLFLFPSNMMVVWKYTSYCMSAHFFFFMILISDLIPVETLSECVEFNKHTTNQYWHGNKEIK